MKILRRIRAYLTRDYGWKPLLTIRTCTDVNGQQVSGPIMVRRVKAVKQYRAETDAEASDRFASEAW